MGASKCSWVFQIGFIGVLSLLSFVALADSAEEYDKANKLISTGGMLDGLVIMRKLALEDYAPAQAVLGEFLDGAEESEEAVGWYMMAANQGNAAGEFGLGSMYLKGLGVEKSPEKALYWITRAFDKGYLNAIRVMASAYRVGPTKSGLPVEIDVAMAKKLAEKIKIEDDVAKKLADEAVLGKSKEVKK